MKESSNKATVLSLLLKPLNEEQTLMDSLMTITAHHQSQRMEKY